MPSSADPVLAHRRRQKHASLPLSSPRPGGCPMTGLLHADRTADAEGPSDKGMAG